MQQQKKIPERKCVGCGEKKEKRELIRVVRSPEGEVSIDLTGKKAGRGAYICHDAACLKKALKARRIETALEVTLPEDAKEALIKELDRG